MAKTTKDTAKEWIEGLRELSKELMDDSKEHRKEANEHKKQSNTLNQIEDGIKETLNIKAEGGQIDFDSVVDTGQPHDMLKKGGKTMSREDITEVLKDELEPIMEQLESDYEGYGLKGEEVEYESRDGFIPFTDGGYEYDFYALGDYLRGSGMNLPTNTLDAELERVEALNFEYGLERFEEEYPEIVKELGGIENVE